MSKQDFNEDSEISLESLEDVLGLSEEGQEDDDSQDQEDVIDDLLKEGEEEEEEVPEPKLPTKNKPKQQNNQEDQEEEEDEPTLPAVQETEFFNKAKTLIDLGFIDDMRISTSEDDEEGVLLSELKELSEDQFQAIIDSHKDTKQTEIKDKYISKEGLSEDNIKFIEILQNGGDIKDLFQTPEEAVRPFTGLDIENEKDQARMALSFYMTRKGNTLEEATPIVREIVKNGKLEDFAKQVFDYENQEYDKKVDAKNQELIQKQQEEKDRIKKITGDLKVTLKEANFKDAVSKKLISSVTKKNKDGVLPIEEAFRSLLENPQENYEKLLHILDEDSFNGLYNIKRQKKDGIKTLKILEAIPKTRKTQQAKDNNETGNNSLHSILLGEE